MKRVVKRVALTSLLLATAALGGCYYPYGPYGYGYGYPRGQYYDGYPGYARAYPRAYAAPYHYYP